MGIVLVWRFDMPDQDKHQLSFAKEMMNEIASLQEKLRIPDHKVNMPLVGARLAKIFHEQALHPKIFFLIANFEDPNPENRMSPRDAIEYLSQKVKGEDY